MYRNEIKGEVKDIWRWEILKTFCHYEVVWVSICPSSVGIFVLPASLWLSLLLCLSNSLSVLGWGGFLPAHSSCSTHFLLCCNSSVVVGGNLEKNARRYFCPKYFLSDSGASGFCKWRVERWFFNPVYDKEEETLVGLAILVQGYFLWFSNHIIKGGGEEGEKEEGEGMGRRRRKTLHILWGIMKQK